MSDKLVADILVEHFPIELRCDHDKMTDICICACGTWPAPEMPSVEAAIRSWAEHVAAVVAPPPPRNDQVKKGMA